MGRTRSRLVRPGGRRAMALASVVLVVCVLNIAVVAMVLGTGDDQRVAVLRADSIRAFLAAESGIAIAVTEVHAGRSLPEGDVVLAGGQRVTLSASAATAPCMVTVTGAYGEARRRVVVELDSR